MHTLTANHGNLFRKLLIVDRLLLEFLDPLLPFFYRLQLRKGNVFTSVCQEFCPQGRGCGPPGQTPTTPIGRPPQADVPLGRHPHPPYGYYGIWSTSGRYASYWNAILFIYFIYFFLKKFTYLFKNRLNHKVKY